MAQVTVRINGYAYTVGCEDGQEAHLTAMAEQVEHRIESIKATAGQTGESKLLVLASLLMADELHDLKLAMADLPRQPGMPPLPSGPDPALTRTLGRLAQRAEEIAASLERP